MTGSFRTSRIAAPALAAALVLALVASPAAHADGPAPGDGKRRAAPTPASAAAPATAMPEFRIAIDQARAVASPGPVRGVVIGNPSIAGVTVQNERLVFVTGRSYGSTNLILIGDRGPIFQGRITVVSDESNAVIVTKGAWSVRYDCTPECKRRPDPSDEPSAFSSTMGAITARAGAASQ
ncbi:MAG: pilus assembly protein N-terminal domain-containing protein [Alphaproteobacteria bacterium]|nr:pilus assembly protein N-terminal domain-containing protein [Alphaproteobacteria bacterium]